MAYANQLREAGSSRKALREYRALVYEWPDSAEAPAAQLQFANLLFERGKISEAFNEYQFLVETYPGFFPYDQVLKRQVEIAEQTALSRHGFLFITWSNQEDATPMFEKILQNAPTWDRTGRLRFRIGEIHENTGEYELAIEAFTSLLIRMPASPHAEEAAYRRCSCHLRLTRYYPHSMDIRAQAAMACAEFIRRFPRSKHAVETKNMLDALDAKQAASLYNTARLYDRAGGHPVSATLMYNRLLDEYPDSPLAATARARLAALRPGPYKEKHANTP